jgi:hypothetical protein
VVILRSDENNCHRGFEVGGSGSGSGGGGIGGCRVLSTVPRSRTAVVAPQ